MPWNWKWWWVDEEQERGSLVRDAMMMQTRTEAGRRRLDFIVGLKSLDSWRTRCRRGCSRSWWCSVSVARLLQRRRKKLYFKIKKLQLKLSPKCPLYKQEEREIECFFTILYDSKPELYPTISLRCATNFNIAFADIFLLLFYYPLIVTFSVFIAPKITTVTYSVLFVPKNFFTSIWN